MFIVSGHGVQGNILVSTPGYMPPLDKALIMKNVVFSCASRAYRFSPYGLVQSVLVNCGSNV